MNEYELDVVVLGEVLVEVATDRPVAHGVPARIGMSGDAFNVAVAAARAGARVGLASVLTDDDLGQAIAERVAELGVSTALLRFRPGQQGVYLVHSDPEGERAFSYARNGSVGSTLTPHDLDEQVLAGAGAVVTSGITCAISDTAREAVRTASRLAKRFVFDPNHRALLTTREAAAEILAELAPASHVVTPSFPGESKDLLGCRTPLDAAYRLLDMGSTHVAVTCGARGVQLASADQKLWIDAVPAPRVVDQTGAGDSFVGTLTARLVLGDSLEEAARLAAAVASLNVGGQGGTGLLPSLEEARAHVFRPG